ALFLRCNHVLEDPLRLGQAGVHTLLHLVRADRRKAKVQLCHPILTLLGEGTVAAEADSETANSGLVISHSCTGLVARRRPVVSSPCGHSSQEPDTSTTGRSEQCSTRCS